MNRWLRLLVLGIVALATWRVVFMPMHPHSYPEHEARRLAKTLTWLHFQANRTVCQTRQPLNNPGVLSPEVLPQVDPWDHPMYVECRNGVFEVRSAGPDGKLDTQDDIFEDTPMEPEN